MMKEEFRSRVYTDRPDYADFDAPAKFNAIQSIIAKRLREHPNAICSYSGGSDSDIMIDLIERTRKIFDLPHSDHPFVFSLLLLAPVLPAPVLLVFFLVPDVLPARFS